MLKANGEVMNVRREVPVSNPVIDEPGTKVMAETVGKGRRQWMNLKQMGEFGTKSNSGSQRHICFNHF